MRNHTLRGLGPILFTLSLTTAHAAPFDWRFADPNSHLIAGSTLSPTSTSPIAIILYHSLTPVAMVPPALQGSLSSTQAITYSLVTSKDDILVLSGNFNLAALRSAAATAGMVSQLYRGVEILGGTSPSGKVQIAIVHSGANGDAGGEDNAAPTAPTLVVASAGVTRAAIDRFLTNPRQAQSNPLIQQSATYGSGFDFFVLSAGMSASGALAFLNPKQSSYLNTKAPGLNTALSSSTGFQFRGRMTNFRLEIGVTEPTTALANQAAAGLSALPASIKAAGPGVASLLNALATNTSVQTNGLQVTMVINPTLYSLTEVVSPPGAGTLSPSTQGIPFAANAVVTLTATPGACYGLPNWSSNAPNGTVTMTANQTVTATFTPAGIAATANQVTVSAQPPTLNSSTGRYQQSITLHNGGPALSNATLIFDNLTPGVSLYQASGTTVCAPSGSPYRNLGSLSPAFTTINVEFTLSNPSLAIQYTPRLLAGAGSR